MLSVGIVVVFSRFVAIFGKTNMALLVKKICGNFFSSSKSVFGYFKTVKKVPMTTKLERGGGLRPLWSDH